MKINGNIGIDTMSPNYKLHVIGDIAYTGGCFNPFDLRLKENIAPLENAVERVSTLHGIFFNFKDKPSSEREIGVIFIIWICYPTGC